MSTQTEYNLFGPPSSSHFGVDLGQPEQDLLQSLKDRVKVIIQGIELIERDLYKNDPQKPQAYFNELKERVIEVVTTSELELDLDESPETINREGLRSLNAISEEWPIALMKLRTEKIHEMETRIEFARTTYTDFLTDSDEIELQRYQEDANNVIDKLKASLKQSKDDESKKRALNVASDSIQKIRDLLETKLELFSMYDFKNKMLNRIRDITNEFEHLDFIKVEELVEEVVENAEKRIFNSDENEKTRAVIKDTVNRLQEIDMEIEKENAICEIQKRYKQVLATIAEANNSSLSFSEEARNAAESVQSSAKRIRDLRDCAFGLSPPVKLDLAKQGTLSALDRLENYILVESNHAHFQEIMPMLPYSCGHEKFQEIAHQECEAVEKTKKNAEEEVKEELQWGEQRIGTMAPPMLGSDKMEEIINKNLGKTSIEVCLAYAEQRMLRSLNFHLLRKEYENMSKENRMKIKAKADDLIHAMKKDIIQTLVNDKKLLSKIKQGSKQEIENAVDVIISKTYIELLNYTPT